MNNTELAEFFAARQDAAAYGAGDWKLVHRHADVATSVSTPSE